MTLDVYRGRKTTCYNNNNNNNGMFNYFRYQLILTAWFLSAVLHKEVLHNTIYKRAFI